MANMIFKRIRFILLPTLIILVTSNCVEPFEPKTTIFESVLVIEATITNEPKRQEIFLGRTYRFESEGPAPEPNANVKIVDNMGNEFVFQETVAGTYVSTVVFEAEADNEYRLLVTTGNGRSYVSEKRRLPTVAQIDNLYAERITHDDGIDGIAIYVDSFDPSGGSRNYRYEYEETYKIIAPKWVSQDLVVTVPGPGIPPCAVEVVPRENEERICYATDNSNSIILEDTNGLEEDRVSRLLVRFINRDNYIISHRYSILVRQLVQSNSASAFFETLDEFSNAQSLFSETQPGFLSANVFSEDGTDEKVLGYFDVATVSERRIFFDYDDFFPGEPLPSYIVPCLESAPPLRSLGGACVLSAMVENDLVRYIGDNGTDPGEGPHVVVSRICGDCTVLGTNEVPEFWSEE